MADDTESLPPELRFPDAADQDRLLSAMRRLVESQGHLTLVRAPIIDADPAWLPDDYAGGLRGVRTLARRLLAYVGLGPRRVIVRVAREANFTEFSAEGRGRWAGGAAAWFEGIDSSVCRFGVNAAELRDPVGVVGSLCHEVAHAWRADRGIQAMDAQAEELSTDLTAVYLGFGIHLLNSSSTFRTGGYDDDGAMLSYEHSSRGYLSPGQIALLLAAQVVARDALVSERKRIGNALSSNQRMLFLRATDLLSQDPVELRARIGVPEPPWADGAPWEELTRPLEPDDAADAEPEVEDLVHGMAAHSPTAHLVTHSRAGLMAVSGAMIPLLASLIVSAFHGLPLVGAIVGAAIVGAIAGSFWKSSRCSACQAGIRRSDVQCPRCGAQLNPEGPPDDDDDELDNADPAEDEGAEPAHDMPGIQCPRCSWRPSLWTRWRCECGHRWNTFITRGLCPECGKNWQSTKCHQCGRWSHHGEWYEASESDAATGGSGKGPQGGPEADR